MDGLSFPFVKKLWIGKNNIKRIPYTLGTLEHLNVHGNPLEEPFLSNSTSNDELDHDDKLLSFLKKGMEEGLQELKRKVKVVFLGDRGKQQ